MNRTQSFCTLLVLHDTADLDRWVRLAVSLTPEGGQINLRGLITIPEDKSLSEGATQARQFRDALEELRQHHAEISDKAEVRVDYHPMARVLDELPTLGVDLLLVQWAGPFVPTGGLSTDEILRQAVCDVVLVAGKITEEPSPVFLSLRGGPNLSLGMNVAKALSSDSSITLFHAADTSKPSPHLPELMKAEPRITRAVTAVSNITGGIMRESVGHKAIVLGATFSQPQASASASGQVIRELYEQTAIPLVLVRAWQPEAREFHLPRRTRVRESLSTMVDRWFAENTFHSHEFADLQALHALKEKQGITISVGLPALNEEETVGKVIATLKQTLMDEVPLVDEIVLIDSNSTDNTVAIAESCGIPAYRHSDILPEQGTYVGKGEALWKSLDVLKGDIVAWIDTDITNIHPRFIYGLLGPLLRRPQVQYVKGFYQRPIQIGGQMHASGGGRVTELVVRPLLNLFYPELSGIIQPLSGEYAGRRKALESVPFFTGYGVETGLLLDLHQQYGLEAIAQADLEERVHHNQPLVGLSKMSFAILQVFIARLESRYNVSLLEYANRSMKLIAQTEDRFALDIVEIEDMERPPMVTIPAYREASLAH